MVVQTTSSAERLKALVRTIPDFPKPGIQFRDVTTVLQNAQGLQLTVQELVDRYRYTPLDKVVAIESRGFVLGGALAQHLHCGLVLARKPGKLPGAVERQEYALEYGRDCLEIHQDAVSAGERCLIVDDLLATGGTCHAACQLVEKLGGIVAGCVFLIALPDLKGHERLAQYDLHWLIEFEGD